MTHMHRKMFSRFHDSSNSSNYGDVSKPITTILLTHNYNHMSSVQNPSVIPLYCLVNRDSPIGLL